MTPTLAKFTFDNADPPWFWIGLVIASLVVLGLTYRGIYRRSGKALTWALAALRIAGVLALIVALVKPAWIDINEDEEKPRLGVVLDDSQSMGLMHQTTDGQTLTRYQTALRWLNETDSGRRLKDRFEVHVFDIAGQEREDRQPPKEPASEQTDLVRALRSAAARLRGQHAVGVVLISDGRDTTGREYFQTMQEYALPVYSVGFRQPASTGSSYDLRLVSVDGPPRTLVHNAVQIQALVGKDGGDAVELPIQIERGGVPLATQRVTLPAGATQQVVTLSYTPDQPGDFVLTARLPEQPGERTGTNNAKPFKLRVDAEPIRVLYIEGYLRPEYTFLRDRLGNDPDVDLVTFVRSANPEQTSVPGNILGGELINAERLSKIDVVLLGDFEAGMLDEPTYAALRQWIENGGAMMVLGGYHNLGEGGLAQTPLREALPVELQTGPLAQLDEAFEFKLTEAGKRHPAMYVTGDATRDTQMWETLPRLRGVALVGAAKPAATVLARHPIAPPGAADKDGAIVLASHPFGKGTVAVFTADTTWRWSRIARLAGKPDAMYSRFWSQMVRWLARRDVQNERPALAVSTDAAVYERGQRVTVKVQRNPAAIIPGEEGRRTALHLTISTPDGRVTPLSAGQSADPNTWTASYFPDRGGRFEVDARLAAAGEKGSQDVANQRAEFLVHASSLEVEDPSTNPEVLKQIATPTGGVYTDIDDAEGLARMVESLPSDPVVKTEAVKASVWNHPLLFVFFLACVTAEWIARRRNHLV